MCVIVSSMLLISYSYTGYIRSYVGVNYQLRRKWYRIWYWSSMPCETHGPRDLVIKNLCRMASLLSSLNSEGHVFHTAWQTKSNLIIMFVCLRVLLLSNFWLIQFCLHLLLSTIYRQCQAASVQSHQRPTRSAVAIATCDVYWGIYHWSSDLSNCSHWSFEAAMLPINPNIYTDQCEPIIIYHSIPILTVIQLCSPWCWHLADYCRAMCNNRCWDLCCPHCYRICICWVSFSRIHRFLLWLGQLSTVLTKDGSPHTDYTFTPEWCLLTP